MFNYFSKVLSSGQLMVAAGMGDFIFYVKECIFQKLPEV